MTDLATVAEPGDHNANQEDTVQPYTDADVQLAARARFDAEQRRIVAEHPLLPVVPTRWSDVLPTVRRRYEYDTRAVLDALAAAGRLATNGRCGEVNPVQITHAPRPVCALPARHAGWHRGDDGCEWGTVAAPSLWERRAAATGGGPCDRCGEPFYTHVCLSCSPDSQTPGPGCHNCRQTGMDQTPCLPPPDSTGGTRDR